MGKYIDHNGGLPRDKAAMATAAAAVLDVPVVGPF